MAKADDLEHVELAERSSWRQWLKANHNSSPGAWIVTYKKSSGKRALTYDDIVEEALCFGWIDSKARSVDEERTKLLLTPRRPGSGWSRPNKERIARMEKARKMTAAGRKIIEAAKADGSWTLLDDVENLVVPGDLARAFRKHKGSKTAWESFPRSVKRATLEWIVGAKRPETRAKRVAKTAELAAKGERAAG
jgi:uncharacterized protein YdeI (YjbR/CyaY-like superfamily)